MKTALLWTRNFSGGYVASVPAFRPVDLSVGAGEVVALVGKNGTGKTSLALGLLGLLPWTKGSAGAGDRPLVGPTWRRVRNAGLGVALQRLRVFSTLTAAETLRLSCGGGDAATDLLDRHSIFEPLRPLVARRGQVAATLSGGEQALLNLACAVGSMRIQGVLCLDEPLANVSPVLHPSFAALVRSVVVLGSGVLILEHRGGPTTSLGLATTTITLDQDRSVISPEDAREDPATCIGRTSPTSGGAGNGRTN